MRKNILYQVLWMPAILLGSFFNRTHSQAPSSLSLKDTGSIMKQLRLTESMSAKQPDSAILLAEQALKSSRQINFSIGISKALLETGIAYQNKNDFSRSVALLRSAISYTRNVAGESKEKIKILYFTGDGYWFQSKTDSAALYYYQALDEINISHTTDPQLLLETYSRLILMWVNLNDTYSPAAGAIDKYTGSAIAYFDKMVLPQEVSKEFRSKVLLNQGHIKKMEHKYDSARYFYSQFLNLAKPKASQAVNPSGWMVATLLNISEMFLDQNLPDSAIAYANQAIAYIGVKKSGAPMYFIIANYYVGKALLLKKDYKESIRITAAALKLSQQNNRDYAQYIAYETLAKAYGATGEYQKAWESQNAFVTITDSLKKNSNMQTISQMEMKYRMIDDKKELAEKELTISIKDNSIRNQRIFFGAIIIGFLLILIVGFLLYRQHTNRHRIKLLRVEKEMELSHLNAMMQGEEKERSRLSRELHDGIGGLLGSIRLQLSSALKTYKIDDASGDFSSILKLLEGAYADLRKTAHNLMPETLQQEGLETATMLFCRNASKGGKPLVVFEVVGKLPPLPPDIELSLYRIVQELVHNVIKHANAKQALVQLSFIDNRITITVEDDGDGFSENHVISKHEGIGLQTIRNRMKSLGGTVDVSATPGEGTSVYIELEIEQKEILKYYDY